MSGNAGQTGALIGAVAGLAVAYFFPPAAGYSFVYFAALASAGSAVGGVAGGLYETMNADDTINKQEAIADLRVQTSTFGQAIPQVFGTGSRLSGNIIWATAKRPIEHRSTQSGGGKGGPKVVTVTTTYVVSLAIALCDTRLSGPMYGAPLRAWKNANLVTDVGAGAMPNNWAFYTGDPAQLPDPTMEAAIGVGNVPAYRYLCYIVMTDEDLGQSGQLPQWSFEIMQPVVPEGNLDTIVTQLCNAAGLSGAALDVSGLPVIQVALTLTSIEAVRASLEQLALAYDFYGLESGLTFFWRSTGTGGIVATIPEAESSAGEEKANDNGAQLDRAAPLELPTIQYFTYIDRAQNYQRNTQPSAVVLPPSGKENPKNITTPLVLSGDQARRRSTQLVALSWVQREPYADVLSRKYCYLEPGDKVNFEMRGLTYPVVLGSTTYGAPGLVDVRGRVNGAPRLGTVSTAATVSIDGLLHDAPTIPPGAVVVPPPQVPPVEGETTPLLLNLPVLDSSDQAPRYHVAYVGENEPWEGGVLYRSVDGEATYQAVDAGALEAITGTVAVALPTVADWTVRDDTTVMRVVLEYGTLTTVNDAANAAGVQRVMVGDEMVFIGTATLVATREYDCSRLWRGRQGTELDVGTHVANEAFVLLDAAVHKIAMTTAERGISYPFKAVSRSQSIADVTAVNFTPTALNLVPWAILPALCSRPVQDWQIRFNVRARFVPGGFDPDWIGFRIIIYADNTFTTIKRTINTSGGYALDATVLKGFDYLASQQVVDFGSIQTVLYFSVAQVGAYAVGRSVNRTSTDLATVQGAIESVDIPGVTMWIEVTTASQAMTVGKGYVANFATLCTLTLPAAAVLGDIIEVAGKGAGKWRIAQAAGQTIFVGRRQTTVGVTGSVSSRHSHDACRLVCIVANTTWEIISFA